MGLHVYRPVLLHVLHEDDHDRRLEFCELFQKMHVDHPNFIANIIWSEEAVFKLNGTINRHNCVFYDVSNPHVRCLRTRGQLTWSLCLGWCLVRRHNRTILFPRNCNRWVLSCHAFHFLWPAVQHLAEDGLYFQQDGAQPHYSLIVREWLDNHFPNMWIGRRGPIDWPARFSDLTVPDFFLWGLLKNKVYGRNPRTMDDLKNAITEEIRSISLDLVNKVCRPVLDRIKKCIEHDGHHFEHLLWTLSFFMIPRFGHYNLSKSF